MCVTERQPGEEKASGADGHLKETVPPAARGTAPEGLRPRARPACLCPQSSRERPRAQAGGCSDGGGEQPQRQNSCCLWAGAALAGSLRRASSKDGQRVRRRPRPRSPLTRRPAPRPGAAAGGRCGAGRPPEASGRGTSGTGSGRARPRRLPSPPDAEVQRQWPRGRRAGPNAGLPAAPSPHLFGVPGPRDAGARPGGRRAAPTSRVPTPGRGAGRSAGASAGPGPRRGACGNPCGPRGRERGAGSLHQKGTRFPFLRFFLVQLCFDHLSLSV